MQHYLFYGNSNVPKERIQIQIHCLYYSDVWQRTQYNTTVIITMNRATQTQMGLKVTFTWSTMIWNMATSLLRQGLNISYGTSPGPSTVHHTMTNSTKDAKSSIAKQPLMQWLPSQDQFNSPAKWATGRSMQQGSTNATLTVQAHNGRQAGIQPGILFPFSFMGSLYAKRQDLFRHIAHHRHKFIQKQK